MSASAVFRRMAELTREGVPFALATVVRTQGSTPQVVGAKLVVTDADARGKAAGTLGGGCVEADAITAAREVMRVGGRTLNAYSLAEDLAWNTGLVCGGTMWILAERGDEALSDGRASRLDALVQAADGGAPIAIATLLRRKARESVFAGRLFVQGDGDATGGFDADAHALSVSLRERAISASTAQLPHGTPRLIALNDTHDLLIDPVTGRPQLVIAGGGHVAQAIARQAALLDFDVTVLEDRPDFADPARFAGARVIAGDIPASLAAFDYAWAASIVIATRGHKLDADCVRAALGTRARYIGVLGSRRKQVLIEQMLRDEGVSIEKLRAIRAPVGLDLGGRTPAEIALSVLAEMTRERYRASGVPLSGDR